MDSSSQLERQLLWILVVVFLGFLTAAGISAWTAGRYANAESLRIEAYAELQSLDAILLAFDDAETGQRGFLLTGNTTYLMPYHEGLGRIDAELDQLSRLVDDDASKAAVDRIRQLIQLKFDELEKTINVRQQQGLEQALELVNSNAGKSYMDELRDVVAGLKAQQKEKLEDLQDRTVIHMKIYQYSATFFVLFLMLAILSVWTMIRRDMESKRQLLERLDHEASHDALTGLPNRNLFVSILDYSIPIASRYQRTLGVMFIDLDGFKAINDTFGHAAGDAVLKEAARRLKEGSRQSDVVARIGGDEFLILIPNINQRSDLEVLASHLLAGFDTPIVPSIGPAKIGASIGIAVFPDDGIRSTELIKAADVAMYRAKGGGKHRFVFHSAEDPLLS
ncbi:MAG TPA: diguanylate cyclase [Noviherbaspirillum sp.]|jgi:diguanylate cyclase (GGDEF)-like protein|uniref:diguanylate cyclase domain-containing protein n=1 Tax=Noviherbaspirillum sp. TaxID=1926288 RepID=UPI002DDD3DF4|nr:diguanylate cyclase [Noviherbaspirillum sp.]HEV2612617.1 diguanylate cyclase [Noviherbaspirillum sp.]